MLYPVARAIVRTVYRVLWPTTVTGLENVPTEGPVVLASNHRAFMDSILIPMVVPRRVVFIAKSEYFTGTGLRGAANKFFFTLVGAIPVDRAATTSATAALDQAVSQLRLGNAFGIYPEGTRSRTGKLYRGRTGVAWIALRENVPVVPVGLIGTDRAQNIANNRLRPFKRLTVSFGEPISPADFADLKPAKARRAMTDRIMTAIGHLVGQTPETTYAPSSATASPARELSPAQTQPTQ